MGNNLKQLRKAKRLTQEQLADAIGATKRQVGAWERGENELPMDYADTIATLFDCSLDELAGRIDYAFVKLPADESMTEDERVLLSRFRRMNDERKMMFLDMAGALVLVDEIKESK